MQDIHAVSGGTFLGGGDRRMRPQHHQNNHLQALRCPRCDSLNTKFCYYNNYNLSQPRHFCKSCRRYWTKGGVLRNVPVGGGCRKSKRANQKSGAARERAPNPKPQSSSSTESSNLTVTAPSSSATPEEASAAAKTPSISPLVFNFSDPQFPHSNPNFDNHSPLITHPSDGQIFGTEINGYADLIPAPSSPMMVYHTTSYSRVPDSFPNPPTLENPRPLTAVEEIKIPEIETGINVSDLAAAPEWVSNGVAEGGEEHGLFDLTAAVDPSYWSQPPWTDNDQSSLNFLP